MSNTYSPSVLNSLRRVSREVPVGNVIIGGQHPIRIQSMTTSCTRDTKATSDQIMRLADQGCDIVRVTVQGMKEALACEEIKSILLKKGYSIPIVADIHFYPPAALTVIDFVDKVRINPGNYIDKRATFKALEYTDSSYMLEIQKIEDKFTPLIEKCKLQKKSLRIGTNHGSLSDRIMSRYGDTPHGMVESAIEFTKICRKNDFHNLIFSMKASHTQVMIHAYRLLVQKMDEFGWDYPLHLGVTEAGEGEDGRIKSAIGIGSLLLDGIGDTIRVSLTEDPWLEIDPCKRLVSLAQAYSKNPEISTLKESHRKTLSFQKRVVDFEDLSYLNKDGSVCAILSDADLEDENLLKDLRCELKKEIWTKTKNSVDCILLEKQPQSTLAHEKIKELKSLGFEILSKEHSPLYTPVYTLQQAKARINPSASKFSIASIPSRRSNFAILLQETSPTTWEALKSLQPSVIFLQPKEHALHHSRRFFDWLEANHLKIPVILAFNGKVQNWEDFLIHTSAEYGSLFCDGLANGICLFGEYPLKDRVQLAFNILQGSRQRLSKTEFISCPSCGRTLFNLQEVSRRIRNKTAHLPGVKIAIMGCIVNGPGEMADADFGYVGSRPGKVDLYVKKECVERNIDFDEADNRLINLIKDHGMWVDAEEATEVSAQ